MKKSIIGAVALLAGALVAHSQGLIIFGNYGSGYFPHGYIYVALGTTKLGGSAIGPPPTTANYASETGNGNDWTVALYGAAGWNDSASSLSPLLDSEGVPVTTTLATGGTGDDTVGTWEDGDAGIVPGTTGAGSEATVQVYAWYNDGGTYTTYAAAKAAGVPIGFSATANSTLGSGLSPGPVAYLPVALDGTVISLTTASVPEPGTIALGVLGASVFLLRLGKEQTSAAPPCWVIKSTSVTPR